MKLGLVFASLAFVLTTSSAFATVNVARNTAIESVLTADRPVVMPEIVITVAKPVAKPAHAKKFVCGEMYTNNIGGRNADCFWK